MTKIRSFLRSLHLFVRLLAAKAEKRVRPSSVLAVGVLAAVAAVACMNSPAGGDGNVMAAPMERQVRLETVKGKAEGSIPITKAKVQFGLLNTNSQSQELAGTLLAKEVRSDKRRKSWSHAQLEILQQQIAREKAAQEAKRLEEEARRAARRIPVSDEEYDLLLRIVQAEAGGCDDKGKILVANVIINRVLSDAFPDTVREVIYQPSQFQPVSTGRIHSVAVTAETAACVDRALQGEDYSGGALYFMNRRGSGGRASWFDRSLTYLFAHDGHEFFK